MKSRKTNDLLQRLKRSQTPWAVERIKQQSAYEREKIRILLDEITRDYEAKDALRNDPHARERMDQAKQEYDEAMRAQKIMEQVEKGK